MAGVADGETLAEKDMAQVGAAAGAGDLGAHAVGVGLPLDRPGDFLVEAWPAAARIELGRRTVKGGAAAFAYIGSLFMEIMIFSGKWPLGSFLDDHPFFLGRQFLFWHLILVPGRAGAKRGQGNK